VFDAAIKRLPSLGIIERKQIRQNEFVKFARNAWKRQQRPNCAGKSYEAVSAVKKQTSVAETVAAEDQTAPIGIPQRESKRAQTARNTGLAPSLKHKLQQSAVGHPRQIGRRYVKGGAQLDSIIEPGVGKE
jgi:hypothetical protein